MRDQRAVANRSSDSIAVVGGSGGELDGQIIARLFHGAVASTRTRGKRKDTLGECFEYIGLEPTYRTSVRRPLSSFIKPLEWSFSISFTKSGPPGALRVRRMAFRALPPFVKLKYSLYIYENDHLKAVMKTVLEGKR